MALQHGEPPASHQPPIHPVIKKFAKLQWPKSRDNVNGVSWLCPIYSGTFSNNDCYWSHQHSWGRYQKDGQWLTLQQLPLDGHLLDPWWQSCMTGFTHWSPNRIYYIPKAGESSSFYLNSVPSQNALMPNKSDHQVFVLAKNKLNQFWTHRGDTLLATSPRRLIFIQAWVLLTKTVRRNQPWNNVE